VRKHCRLQHLEWLRNLQTTTARNQQTVQRNTDTHVESPRLTALKCLPPSEALDLLQADDWLQDLMDFSGVLPTSAVIPDAPSAFPTTQLAKEPSIDELLDEEQAEMQKVVRLLSMKPQHIAQLGPRERKKVLTIRKSSIQKMQLANEIRKAKEVEKAESEAAESEKGSEKDDNKSAPPGRSPLLRPRGVSLDRSLSFDSKMAADGKGRMPPTGYFQPSKVQKASGHRSNNPDI